MKTQKKYDEHKDTCGTGVTTYSKDLSNLPNGMLMEQRGGCGDEPNTSDVADTSTPMPEQEKIQPSENFKMELSIAKIINLKIEGCSYKEGEQLLVNLLSYKRVMLWFILFVLGFSVYKLLSSLEMVFSFFQNV